MKTSQRKMRHTLLLATVLLATSGTVAAQAEISRGSILASSCFTCHGTDGKAIDPMPTLHGFSEQQIISAMQGFRAGMRSATVMDRHASGYSDEEIAELARYFGSMSK